MRGSGAHGSTARQRVSQGATVDHFKLAAQGDAMGNTGQGQTMPRQHLGNVVSRSFAFNGRVGGQDDLAECGLLDALLLHCIVDRVRG